jgi:hypothetical protein
MGPKNFYFFYRTNLVIPENKNNRHNGSFKKKFLFWKIGSADYGGLMLVLKELRLKKNKKFFWCF